MSELSIGVSAASRVARHLESGRSPGAPARLLAALWRAVSARRVARPLALPTGVRAIGIGGASLGGAGKTPFAIALARALAERGIDVALVGHAYRARPKHARVVDPNDDVTEVGDDALFAARSLATAKVDVIVGPHRQAAATFAARRAECLVFDGLLQARGEKLSRSILLVDGARGWPTHCPPAGDLRAPRHALLRAADAVVFVRDEVAAEDTFAPAGRPALAQMEALSRVVEAVHPDGRAVPLAELRGQTLGVLLTIARPDRVLDALSRRGLRAAATVAFPDHHRPTAPELAAAARTTQRIDVWLTTSKCATKLPSRLGSAPILALAHEIRLSTRLVDWVAGCPFPSAGGVG